MLEAVNVYLEAKGIRIATGTIVDATIIHAPSSTMNASGKRDPEMHQTRKGNQRYFGLKAHIGVVADCHMLPDLLHGEERKVWGDGGYQGQTEAIREAVPHAQDMTCRRTKFKNYVDEEAKRKNTTKSKVRTKVEHVFRILKRVFGFDKVRYRGIAKNHHRLCANFALVNFYLHRKRLASARAVVRLEAGKPASKTHKANRKQHPQPKCLPFSVPILMEHPLSRRVRWALVWLA
jgi:transposase, IS5 family